MFSSAVFCNDVGASIDIGIHSIPVEQIKQIINDIGGGMPWWGPALIGFLGALVGAGGLYLAAVKQVNAQYKRDKNTAKEQKERDDRHFAESIRNKKMTQALSLCIKFYKQINVINLKFNEISHIKERISDLNKKCERIQNVGSDDLHNKKEEVEKILCDIQKINIDLRNYIDECEREILKQNNILVEMKFRCPLKLSNAADSLFKTIYRLFASGEYFSKDLSILNKELAALSCELRSYFIDYIAEEKTFCDAWSIISPIISPIQNGRQP